MNHYTRGQGDPHRWNEISDIETAKKEILSGNPFLPHEDAIKIVDEYCNEQKKKILDFGCGLGRNTCRLRSFGHCVGYDLPNIIEMAVEYLEDDTDLTHDWDYIRAQQFDLIYASLVLQHIPADELQDYLNHFHVMSPVLLVVGREHNDHFQDRTVREFICANSWALHKEYAYTKNELNQYHEIVVFKGV